MITTVDRKKHKRIIFFIFLFPIYYLLSTVYCCFAEEKTTITSESLEYMQETSTYIARGNVKIQRADTILEANEVTYNDETSELIATGNVRYNDKDVSITAVRADLNLDEKTGILYDAEILYKKDNYHISGKEIEKKGDKYYVSPQAAFTTCDAPVPAWCFRGKDIDVIAEDRLKAKDVTFRIKDIPVFYTPYFRAPIQNERKTGFLTPDFGYSKLKGFYFELPFFWAISENRDATFVIDDYSKRGFGEGIEYRYLYPDNIKGKWWLYHIRDNKLNKDFVEFIGFHEQRSAEGIGGYLNINLINEQDYYREYNPEIEIRTNRFLESTGEISLPFSNSRTYLLSQYWIDLKENNIIDPSQRLPEVGYVLNPVSIGHFLLSATTVFSNFWRGEDVHGQRFDVYPKIYHAFGNDVVFSQSLGLRETAYFLQRSDDKNTLHRDSVEYNIEAHTRVFKKYASFTHIVEPSISYTFITNSLNNVETVFDSAELFKKRSLFELSLLNRIIKKDGELMVFRISQGFDSYLGDRPFLPLKLEVGIKKPLLLRFDADYDVHTGRVERTNSDIFLPISLLTLSGGHRYNRPEDITYYKAAIGLHPYKPLYLESKIWYDAKEHEAKEVGVKLKYLSQCWGIMIEYIKRPGDYDVRFLIELKGLTRSLEKV
jgi:LPS-assembly protein